MDVLFQTHSTFSQSASSSHPQPEVEVMLSLSGKKLLVLMGKGDDVKTNFMLTCDKSYKKHWKNVMGGKEGNSQKIKLGFER